MNNTIKLVACPKCGAPIPEGAPQGLCPKCLLIAAATSPDFPDSATDTSEIPSLQTVAAAFPKLEIMELIGRGGMGFVYKARQPQLDRLVALKLLPDKLARDPRFAERFNREGRVLARLSHPNIVSVYDFGVTERFCFLIMEFVEGVNLRQAMNAGRFSPAEALRVVPKICEALQYAHEQGILHRDIKPANILLDPRGQVKIADFGIAKLIGVEQADISLTATGAALGTPHYMAPEQLENPSEVDHRADIYSLGVVFYEMLTGELPIGRFAAPSSKTPVGTNVDDVVFRTLEKDRERRYQSAGEMKTQVEQLDASAGAEFTSEPSPTEISRRSIYGAVLVGLSLPFPLFVLPAILTGAGGIGSGELWLTLGSVGLFGVTGTLLGWLGWIEIRRSHGRVYGSLPALFAALTWPLGMPMITILGIVLFFRVPWNREAVAKRGEPVDVSVPAVHSVSAAVRADFRLAKGQVATLELLNRAEGLPDRSEFSGYAIAPDDERARFSLLLTAAQQLSAFANRTTWRPSLVTEDGASVFGRVIQDLGELVPNLPTNYVHSIEPDSSTELMLTRPGSNPQASRRSSALLSLRMVSKTRGATGLPQQSTMVGTGSTNWAQFLLQQTAPTGPRPRPGEVLAYQWLKSPTGTNITNFIRFTFTNVELRKDAGGEWLAMDYATDVRGNCEEVFRLDGKDSVTRKHGILITPEGSPPVVRQRFEWQIPAAADHRTVTELAAAFAEALVGKSFVIPEGEQRPLLRFPIERMGDVSVGIGTRLRDPSP